MHQWTKWTKGGTNGYSISNELWKSFQPEPFTKQHLFFFYRKPRKNILIEKEEQPNNTY